MTKEELEKEFEKYLKDSSDYYDPREPLTERKLLQMWLDCAEPREKQIAELGERCLQLQKDKGNLTDRVRELEAENEQIKNSDTLCKLIGEQKIKIAELEAQIEKMKCCYNCKHSRTEYEHCRTDKHEKWEIKEK